MRMVLLLVVALALPVTTAFAEQGDLSQAIADLGAQARDKARLDTLGAVTIELNEINTWLREATNAVKEEQEPRCRRSLNRVRAQLSLVDQLIALSQLRAQQQRADKQLVRAGRKAAKAKQDLEERRANLKAMKRMND
jgi:hypothetical protein